jgi:hypothetical protein
MLLRDPDSLERIKQADPNISSQLAGLFLDLDSSRLLPDALCDVALILADMMESTLTKHDELVDAMDAAGIAQ